MQTAKDGIKFVTFRDEAMQTAKDGIKFVTFREDGMTLSGWRGF